MFWLLVECAATSANYVVWNNRNRPMGIDCLVSGQRSIRSIFRRNQKVVCRWCKPKHNSLFVAVSNWMDIGPVFLRQFISEKAMNAFRYHFIVCVGPHGNKMPLVIVRWMYFHQTSECMNVWATSNTHFIRIKKRNWKLLLLNVSFVLKWHASVALIASK